jgi:hypothetical protein
MVQNIPYFKDKGDSNSSAGWKVREHGPNPRFISREGVKWHSVYLLYCASEIALRKSQLTEQSINGRDPP